MTNTVNGVIPATAAQWAVTTNPISKFQLVYESDTGKFKIGDGVSLYSSLPYVLSNSSSPNNTYPTPNAIPTSLGVLAANVFNPVGWGVTGSQQTTTNSGTLAAGSIIIPVVSVIDFAIGNGVYIAGAGANGTPLISKITNVNSMNSTITIANQTLTALNNPATFSIYFNGNTVTLNAVPASPIYPGCILSHGTTVTTILALQSGTANQIGAVYTTTNSITSYAVSALVGVTYLIQHDDTAAINACLSDVNGYTTGIVAINFGGLESNVSSPVLGKSNTLLQNFTFILAPGTQGNFCSIINWQNYTNYFVGQQVFSNGNQYICTQAGISAFTTGASGTGISGTGSGIVDNTVIWNYVGPVQNTTAVLTYSNSAFNAMTEYGKIDINRQPVLGMITGGTSGIIHLRLTITHWITGYHGFYLQGKTITYFCSAAQYNSGDWETNFPTQYNSGSGYFYDMNTIGGTGASGGGTDSYSFQCTAACGGQDGLFHVAAGLNHIRLVSSHPFSGNSNGVALTRTNFNAWAAGTTYAVNTKVVNGNYVYICTFPGTSQLNGSGPTGTFNNQSDGGVTWNYYAPLGNGAWTPNTAYVVGNKVSNNGQTYQAIIAGTSGTSGGPSGIGVYNTFKATTCSISGNVLTIGGLATTPYTVAAPFFNMTIIATGVPTGTVITGVLSGSGANGSTYSISSTLGNISGVSVTSFDIPDGNVVWSYQGTAPIINPCNMLIQGNSITISDCYLDTGCIVIHAIKSSNISVIVQGTNSLNNNGPAQLSSWIDIVAGIANTSFKNLQISTINNWTGGIPILNIQTVLTGTYLNYAVGNYISQLLASTTNSLMSTNTGLTILETNTNTTNVIQALSNAITTNGLGQSYIQFADPTTTVVVPPRIGSNGNDLVGNIGGEPSLRLSAANSNVVLGQSTGLETFNSHLALGVATKNPVLVLEHSDNTHPQGLGVYFNSGTFANKNDAAFSLLDQSGISFVYASTNVGNATIGNIVLSNMNNHVFTLTATSSTTFSVVDTSLGVTLGVATIGIPFVSASLNFTITAGSTPTAVSDKIIVTISFKTAIWSDGSIEHPVLGYQVSDFGSVACNNLSAQTYQIASSVGAGYISGVYDLFWASTARKHHMRVAVGITNNSDTTPTLRIMHNYYKNGLPIISNPTLTLDSSGNAYFNVTVTPNIAGTLLVQARGYSTNLALTATPAGTLTTSGPINSKGGRAIITSGNLFASDNDTIIPINNGSAAVTITLPATLGNFAIDTCILGTGAVTFVVGNGATLNGALNGTVTITNGTGVMTSLRVTMQYNPDGLSAYWFVK